MVTLNQLALEERQLTQVVESLRGTFEQKAEQLERLGVIGRYREIHRQYVRLAEVGDLEALRRAVFLQWIALIEPPVFTGVGVLDSTSESQIMDLLERMCLSGNIDVQLRWMLPHYAVVAEWWLEAEKVPALAAFCRRSDAGNALAQPRDCAYEGRGQLGEYWKSIHRGGG